MINQNYPIQNSRKPVLSSSAYNTSSVSNSTQISILYGLDNKNITTNQNKNNISNTDDIHSYVTPQKQNYSVQATSTIPNLTTLTDTLLIPYIRLHTTTKLPPASK